MNVGFVISELAAHTSIVHFSHATVDIKVCSLLPVVKRKYPQAR
jgi:hypothetical protein